METRLVVAGIVAGVGLVMVVVGCILIPVFDDIVEDQVIAEAKYENGTEGYNNFVNSSSPTYTYFYFFNVTNPNEIINNSAKPILQEIGPYVYRTTKPKESLVYREDGTEIRYQTRPTYYYDVGRSNGADPFTDTIVNVNYVILTTAKSLETYTGDDLPDFMKRSFLRAVNNNGDAVFEAFTIDDYLWGYHDMTLNESGLIPLVLPSATEGIFYGVNTTLGDEFVVFTGTDEIDRVNDVEMWKGIESTTYVDLEENIVPIWRTTYANMLNGTDGTQYKPFIEKDDRLYTFSSDLCRSFSMMYDSEVDVKGIKAYRFVLDPANLHLTEENKAFCIPDDDSCLPEGLLNAERCYEEAPVVISLPHLYQVDSVTQETIEGLNPVKEMHETAIDVEPTTGFSVQGNKRIQINMRIQQWELFPDTNRSIFAGDGFIIPVFWLNEQTIISDTDAEDFKNEIIEPIELLEIFQYVIIGVGAFVMLVALITLTYFKCTNGRKV